MVQVGGHTCMCVCSSKCMKACRQAEPHKANLISYLFFRANALAMEILSNKSMRQMMMAYENFLPTRGMPPGGFHQLTVAWGSPLGMTPTTLIVCAQTCRPWTCC